jgi:hypothetical protein
VTEPTLPSPALYDEPTRRALREYTLRATGALGAGIGGWIIAFVAVQPNNGNPPAPLSFIAVVGFSGGLVVMVMGLTGVIRSRRFRFRLNRHEWVTRRADYRIAAFGANGQPALLIRADSVGPEVVCAVPMSTYRYHRLPEGRDQPLLVVGDPRRWAVIAPTDRSVLLLARQPLLRFWARRVKRYAES